MSSFQRALDANPAPTRLGDVTLRYDTSLLIGETATPRRTWRPTLAWLAGIALLLGSIGAIILSAPLETTVSLLLLAAGAIGAGTWLERLDRRRRRFVLNFATTTLRLDFVTPIAGYARTLLVPFDDVLEVSLSEQADGGHCLTIDFKRNAQRLREVLVAFIRPDSLENAERLERLLHGAFGLGHAPSDSPAFDESTFQ